MIMEIKNYESDGQRKHAGFFIASHGCSQGAKMLNHFPCGAFIYYG